MKNYYEAKFYELKECYKKKPPTLGGNCSHVISTTHWIKINGWVRRVAIECMNSLENKISALEFQSNSQANEWFPILLHRLGFLLLLSKIWIRLLWLNNFIKRGLGGSWTDICAKCVINFLFTSGLNLNSFFLYNFELDWWWNLCY